LVAKRSDENLDRYIVVGIEQELGTLRAQQKALEARLDYYRKRAGVTASASAPAPVKRRKRRKLSAAGRKAISDAAKARWAKQKAGKKG
jgi:hypothetical protein